MKSACSRNLFSALRAACFFEWKNDSLAHPSTVSLSLPPASLRGGKAVVWRSIRRCGSPRCRSWQRTVLPFGLGAVEGLWADPELWENSACFTTGGFSSPPAQSKQEQAAAQPEPGGTAGAWRPGSCRGQVQALIRAGLSGELAQLGAWVDYSLWHPGELLTA